MKCDVCGEEIDKAHCTSNACETCCKVGKCLSEETCAYKHPEFIGKSLGARIGMIKRRKKEEENMGIEIYDGTPETKSHWKQKSGKPVIYVDVHHTITDYCGACGETFDPSLSAGNVQKGARESLVELSTIFHITIYTGYKNLEEVADWLRLHEIPFDDIFMKPSNPCFIIDDRAGHKSWAETMADIRNSLSKKKRQDSWGRIGVEPSD